MRVNVRALVAAERLALEREDDRVDDLRVTAKQAAEGLRSLLALIDAGEVEATPARVWHLRGALDALDALLAGRPLDLPENQR
jgi:hypothetical protein